MAQSKFLTDDQRRIILGALELQVKSTERAARSMELAGKRAIAEAMRVQLKQEIEVKHQVADL